MIKEPFKVEEAHGSIQCNNYAFGDPAPGKAKQCYCESGVFEPKVQKCSNENGDCSCKGNIFYGAAVVDGAEADFDALLTKNFAHRKSDGKHAMKCNNRQFGDPLPNEPKQCFCDDIGKMNPTQIQSTIDLNNARLAAAQAAADAEKLEAEATAKEARIQELRKKHMEDLQKQQDANKAKLEAIMAEEAAETKAALENAKLEDERAKKEQIELDKDMHEKEKAERKLQK